MLNLMPVLALNRLARLWALSSTFWDCCEGMKPHVTLTPVGGTSVGVGPAAVGAAVGATPAFAAAAWVAATVAACAGAVVGATVAACVAGAALGALVAGTLVGDAAVPQAVSPNKPIKSAAKSIFLNDMFVFSSSKHLDLKHIGSGP